MIVKDEQMERQLDIIFDNFILKEAKVITINNVIIEVRTKEKGHNIPHCHVEKAEQSASISLIDFKKIASTNMNDRQIKAVEELVKQNKDMLRNKWEEFYGKDLLKNGKWGE